MGYTGLIASLTRFLELNTILVLIAGIAIGAASLGLLLFILLRGRFRGAHDAVGADAAASATSSAPAAATVIDEEVPRARASVTMDDDFEEDDYVWEEAEENSEAGDDDDGISIVTADTHPDDGPETHYFDDDGDSAGSFEGAYSEPDEPFADYPATAAAPSATRASADAAGFADENPFEMVDPDDEVDLSDAAFELSDDDVVELGPVEPLSDIPAGTAKVGFQGVFFGTNRLKSGETTNHAAFSSARSRDLTVGRTIISIPIATREVGEIKQRRHLNLGIVKIPLGFENENKHFMERETVELSEQVFSAEAAKLALKAETYERSAFVFVHGFNVTFRNAMFRAAQMAYDMDFDGPVFAYSWPARGRVRSYVTDMDSAALAVPQLDEFLDIIDRIEGIDHIHMVVHSMGNALLSQLMLRVGTRLQTRSTKLIDQLILAAPDIDRGMFQTVADHLCQHSKGVTLYASSKDKALAASGDLRDNLQRAGYVPKNGEPVIAQGIDTIDVSIVSTDMLGLEHSEFAEDRTVIEDIAEIFRNRTFPPDARLDRYARIETSGGDSPASQRLLSPHSNLNS